MKISVGTERIIEGYARDADLLISRYEAIDCSELYAPVSKDLPVMPSDIVVIGAGTGRDAAWFAEKGHRVVAVEPVLAFRDAGQKLHSGHSINWLEDRLPDLENLRARQQKYDVILISGVWHHLTDDQRACAVGHIAKLLKPDGIFILSLRHGPGAAARPVQPCDPQVAIDGAVEARLRLLHHQSVGSMQTQNIKLGVKWTWLVFSLR